MAQSGVAEPITQLDCGEATGRFELDATKWRGHRTVQTRCHELARIIGCTECNCGSAFGFSHRFSINGRPAACNPSFEVADASVISTQIATVGCAGIQIMDPTNGYDAIGYAAHDPQGGLKPFKFKRRFPGPDDVVLDVTHCGICYSELVWTKNYLGDVQYPVVPGHEVVGVVKELGKNVTRFKPGDRVGVGYQVMSCRSCELCDERQENYCEGLVCQFNHIDLDKTITRGGFSNLQVTNERYVVHIPDALQMENAAPLLCAGITVFCPLKHHGAINGGKRVGIVGLGGLGHLAVLFAKAMGNHVTVLSTTESKKEEALKELGADAFIFSKDQEAIQAARKSLDLVIDCAAGIHPIDPLLSMLKHRGVLVMVGVPREQKFSPSYIVRGSSKIAGSLTGGMLELQEMLDFAAEKGVVPHIETIPIHYVNEALARLQKNDVRFRFVVDIANSLKP